MTKKLIQHGNSAALVIDKPILDLLSIDPDLPITITTDGTNLILSPQRGGGEAELALSLDKINARFGNALRKLGQ